MGSPGTLATSAGASGWAQLIRRQAQRPLTQATPIRQPTPTEFEFKVLNLNLMAPPHPTLILWSSARVSNGRRYPRFHDGAITMGIEGQFAGLAVRTRHQPAFVRGGRGKGYLSDIGRFAMLERDRSEERRVGKECRTRGGPYHKKKKKSRVERLNVLAVAEWNTPRLDMN